MINEKFYKDIKEFPSQFAQGYNLSRDLRIDGNFNKVIVCGVGGSALFTEIINDYLSTFSPFRLNVNRSYTLPNYSDNNSLFLIVSHSGNTEETLSCLNEVVRKGYKFCIITSGGKLLDYATNNKTNLIKLPGGVQPRLSTGYFISSILQLLTNVGLIKDTEEEIRLAGSKINESLDEEKAKQIATQIKGKVPVIYSTIENSSIAMVSKIKFNENTKTQAFWNYFSELNHNEMVGFTNLVMSPFFIIYKSQYVHERYAKRIEVFAKIMRDKGCMVEVVEMTGSNIMEEILNAYYFIDHVSYYLSVEYDVDPEPVALVEEYKKLI